MTHHEFNQLIHAATALPPEQMQQLRDELDRKLAATAAPSQAVSGPGSKRIREVAEEIRRSVPAEESAEPPTTAPGHRPIWEEILDLAAGIPDEEFAKLPVDGAEQHDHYIYGTPKRPPTP